MLRVWALRVIRLSFFVFFLNAFFLLAVKVGFRVWGSGLGLFRGFDSHTRSKAGMAA